MKKPLILVFLLILMAGCRKQNDTVRLNADFSIGDTLLRVNETVDITNLSDSISIQYRWDFGDGFGSAERTPVHSYINPGNYDIKLVIKNEKGDSDSIINNVKVGERFVYGLMVNSINLTKWYPNYGNWDSDSTGINSLPDLIFFVQETDNLPLYQSNVIYNVDLNRLPVFFQVPDVRINPGNNIGVGSTGIYLKDRDGTDFETMVSTLLSGVQSNYSNYVKQYHTGEFSVGYDGNSFTVRYKIR